MFLMVLQGYVYTIMPYFYAFCLAFSCKSQCILHRFTLHLAPKRTAFSTKTQCILHQNAVRLAAYRSKFSNKHPRNWCKWRYYEINIHFAAFTIYPLFASKQTSARIDFLRSSGQLVDKKGTFCVKILAEKWTTD